MPNSGFPQLYVLNQDGVTVFDGSDQGLVQANSVAPCPYGTGGRPRRGRYGGGKRPSLHRPPGGRPGALALVREYPCRGADRGEGRAVPTTVSSTAESPAGFGTLAPLTASVANFLIGTSQGAIGTQGQATASTTASASTSTGASATSAVVSAIVSQVAQPLFSPSLRSYASLLETLAQIGQSQIAEILPLSGNDMAAVAVLLVVSDTSDPAAAGPVANRTDLMAELSTLIEPDAVRVPHRAIPARHRRPYCGNSL